MTLCLHLFDNLKENRKKKLSEQIVKNQYDPSFCKF